MFSPTLLFILAFSKYNFKIISSGWLGWECSCVWAKKTLVQVLDWVIDLSQWFGSHPKSRGGDPSGGPCRTRMGAGETLGPPMGQTSPSPQHPGALAPCGTSGCSKSALGTGVTASPVSSPQPVKSPWRGLQGDSPKCHLLLANSIFFLGLFLLTVQNSSRWRFQWAAEWHQKEFAPLWYHHYGGFLFHRSIYWSVFAAPGPPGWHMEQVSNGWSRWLQERLQVTKTDAGLVYWVIFLEQMDILRLFSLGKMLLVSAWAVLRV